MSLQVLAFALFSRLPETILRWVLALHWTLDTGSAWWLVSNKTQHLGPCNQMATDIPHQPPRMGAELGSVLAVAALTTITYYSPTLADAQHHRASFCTESPDLREQASSSETVLVSQCAGTCAAGFLGLW